LPANVFRYDTALLANHGTEFEREVAHPREEIHHHAALLEIQCLNHVGWALQRLIDGYTIMPEPAAIRLQMSATWGALREFPLEGTALQAK